MAGGQENSACCFPLSNDVAGGWGGQDAILSDQQLLHTIGSTDLGNELDDLGVPETAVATDN